MTQRMWMAGLALVLGAGLVWWLMGVSAPEGSDRSTPSALSFEEGTTSSEEAATDAILARPETDRTEGDQGPVLPPRTYDFVRLEVLVQAPIDHQLVAPVEVIVEPAFDDGGPTIARLQREAKLRTAPKTGAVAIFEELVPAAYRIMARAPHLDTVLTLVTLDARIPMQRISLTLATLGALEGVVHMGTDKRMIAAFAPVGLQRVERDLNGLRPRFETFSDGNGFYRFGELAPGSYDLTIGPEKRSLRTPIRVEIAESLARQDVGGLPPVGEVALQALDEVGKALSEVTFDITPEQSEAAGGGRGTTDSEGVFRLGGLQAGTYLIHAQREGFHTLQARFELREIGPVPLVHPVVLRAQD